MNVSIDAGKPAEPSMLVNVPRLITAYYTERPDPSLPAQRVAFGTSGHRAFEVAFISEKFAIFLLFHNTPTLAITKNNNSEDGMVKKKGSENCLELYDVATKEKVAEAPLAEIRFIPRTGERIFISLRGAGDWRSYTVVAVEYLLGRDPSTGAPSTSESGGIGRVTLYVKASSSKK